MASDTSDTSDTSLTLPPCSDSWLDVEQRRIPDHLGAHGRGV